MNLTSIIVFILKIVLAFIPMSIAGKKDYNKAGFYVYGFILFIPALIHALILPDKKDTVKRAYSKKAVVFSIIASALFYYQLLNFIVFPKYFPQYHSRLMWEDIVFGVILWISVYALRNRELCSLAYIVGIHESLFSIVNYIYLLTLYDGLSESKERYPLYMLLAVIRLLSYSSMIYVLVVYSKKKKGAGESLSKLPFILPSFLYLLSTVWSLVINTSSDVFYIIYNVYIGSFMIMGMLFVGLFYYEDSKTIEDDEKDITPAYVGKKKGFTIAAAIAIFAAFAIFVLEFCKSEYKITNGTLFSILMYVLLLVAVLAPRKSKFAYFVAFAWAYDSVFEMYDFGIQLVGVLSLLAFLVLTFIIYAFGFKDKMMNGTDKKALLLVPSALWIAIIVINAMKYKELNDVFPFQTYSLIIQACIALGLLFMALSYQKPALNEETLDINE